MRGHQRLSSVTKHSVTMAALASFINRHGSARVKNDYQRGQRNGEKYGTILTEETKRISVHTASNWYSLLNAACFFPFDP